ncbi:MAG TPA: alcohol dehydrogenase catalytic domain-containing protein [Bacteroidales bacterium]|nr:alcohol dehydrogenase catalytic domain-containing protein [Bacteroidales bacterium]
MMDTKKPDILKNNEVLVEMKVVGVCGSDVHYYITGRIGSQVVKYPFMVGHEGSGIVRETGERVTRVKPGDRIAIEPAMPCFECDQCKAGRENTCRRLRFLGCPGQAEGCLCEYIVIPETSCIPIPEQMTFDEAAISEPLAIGLYAVKKAMPVSGMNIAILGFGPVGMSVMLTAKAMGANRIYVTDKLGYRNKMAELSGAYLTGNPDKENVVKKIVDLIPEELEAVFECCGQHDAMGNALDMVRPGGKIMIIGIPEFDDWHFRADKMRRKEITTINVRRQNHCSEDAIQMIATKTVNVSNMVTHRFRLENAKDAFELVTSYGDQVMKAMIDIN